MIIKAIKAWLQYEIAMKRLRAAFRSPTREDRRRMERLAYGLLCWHLSQGRTVRDLEGMIAPKHEAFDAPNHRV